MFRKGNVAINLKYPEKESATINSRWNTSFEGIQITNARQANTNLRSNSIQFFWSLRYRKV